VTVALAQWSGGTVTGIDIDEAALQRLAQRAKQAGVMNQVTIIARSMTNMDFPEASFDVIWAEGAIAVIGFKRGLTQWKPLLKPGGYMVIHDDGHNIPRKQEQVVTHGYTLIDSFFLDEQVWWDEYYSPLAQRMDQFQAEAQQDPALAAKLASSQREINGFHHHPERYRSVFFVLQRQ
jgi:SAM-dependent methyltransferase